MKKILLTLLFLAVSFPCLAHDVQLNAPAHVFFSPKGGCTTALVTEIDRAKATILVMAYNFTSAEIAAALIRAHERGVSLEVVLDKRANFTDERSQSQELLAAGVPVVFDGKHPIMHDKYMVFDGETVATGSFNFTGAAENSNAENLIFIQSKDLSRFYVEDFEKHKGHAVEK